MSEKLQIRRALSKKLEVDLRSLNTLPKQSLIVEMICALEEYAKNEGYPKYSIDIELKKKRKEHSDNNDNI